MNGLAALDELTASSEPASVELADLDELVDVRSEFVIAWMATSQQIYCVTVSHGL